VPLEERPEVNVLVPLGDANRQVAELVRRNVDATRCEAIALLRGKRPIVPNDVANRIGHCLLLSAGIVRHGIRERINRPGGAKGSSTQRYAEGLGNR
jgi:hypothetical protein